MSTADPIRLPTRRLDPGLVELLRSLEPGQRIRITQTVRVGSRKWESITEGVFRSINYLATGLSTERVAKDDVVVPLVHFTKDNSELSSVAIDERTRVEKV